MTSAPDGVAAVLFALSTVFCFPRVVRRLAYDFLDELRKEFLNSHGGQVARASRPYEFIRFGTCEGGAVVGRGNCRVCRGVAGCTRARPEGGCLSVVWPVAVRTQMCLPYVVRLRRRVASLYCGPQRPVSC